MGERFFNKIFVSCNAKKNNGKFGYRVKHSLSAFLTPETYLTLNLEPSCIRPR